MGTRQNWDRLADIWEKRHALYPGRRDPYLTVTMDSVPLDDEMRILDVGCGVGLATVELARRAGPNCRVTGVDLSPVMINHATHHRHAAVMHGDIPPDIVDFRVADASRDDLGTDHDGVFSRFGVMFFDDPKEAFANFASALAPKGWLAFVAWAGESHNPWMGLPTTAAAPVLGVDLDDLAPGPGDPGPFSLADRDETCSLIIGAGFSEPTVMDITQPRRIGHAKVRDDIALSLQIGPLADAFTDADQPTRDAAIDAVIAAMERYREPGPVGDWLIPAHALAYLARRI